MIILGGNGGGGGKSGRSSGGGSSLPDNQQPGEVMREANKANAPKTKARIAYEKESSRLKMDTFGKRNAMFGSKTKSVA